MSTPHEERVHQLTLAAQERYAALLRRLESEGVSPDTMAEVRAARATYQSWLAKYFALFGGEPRDPE